MSVQPTQVEIVKVAKDILGDFADAVLGHAGKDGVPQLAETQRTRSSHAIAYTSIFLYNLLSELIFFFLTQISLKVRQSWSFPCWNWSHYNEVKVDPFLAKIDLNKSRSKLIFFLLKQV